MLEDVRSPKASILETSAWEHFWELGGADRCVPNSPAVSRLLSECWGDFARALPNGGSVLDLGTGVGHVLREISRVRTDLRLLGVDSAEINATNDPRLQIRRGVAMERLPFGADAFDGVCSQFGFEYSNMAASAQQLARVLRPGGQAQLVMHHRDGIIVSQSRARRTALEWVVKRSGMFDEAARLTNEHQALCCATSAAFSESAGLARKLGLDPVAPEVAAALSDMVGAGARGWIEHLRSGLARLATRAANELVILAAIDRVALDAEAIQEIRSILRSLGLKSPPARLLQLRAGAPLAWLLTASKPAA